MSLVQITDVAFESLDFTSSGEEFFSKRVKRLGRETDY
jgi:hypothetical protein